MATELIVNTAAGATTFRPSKPNDPGGLADFLARKGLGLNVRCGQQGVCRGCLIRLEAGALRHRGTGEIVEQPGELLGCRHEWLPDRPATITVPARSLVAHRPAVADDFSIRVPVGASPLFDGEYGIAVDIGTTTVVVLLAELATGKILGRASGFNQQIRYGDDVLARIQLCHGDPAMVATLQRAVAAETVLPLTKEVCARAKVEPAQLGGFAVAGNSTMLHLLFGIDPSPMGIAPFTPRFIEHRVRPLGDLGLDGFPDIPVHALPGFAAYVGADIAAGVFATGISYETRPTLFVDVGTNGEIVLRHGNRLLACATAAGPAFEGNGLSCGMRAAHGAIERIAIGADPLTLTVKTIGGAPAAESPGVCGSGYIDFLAQGRQAGLLNEAGRFVPAVVAAHPELFGRGEYDHAVYLAGSPAGPRISEADVARLLQAKAAIAAGIQTLLYREHLEPAAIDHLCLAGGFGMHLDVRHAIASGLLPGFSPGQVEAVGNTSLGGAYLTMLDQAVLDELDRIRWQAEIVELNLDPGFEDRFIENLALP